MGKKRLKPYAPEVIEMLVRNFVFERIPHEEGPASASMVRAGAVAKKLMGERPRWMSAILEKYEREHPSGTEMEAMFDELAPFLLAYAKKTIPNLRPAPYPLY